MMSRSQAAPSPDFIREHRIAAAEIFMKECDLVTTPDAIEQLVDAFLPALTVMCKRGYDPNGETWKAGGWRGLLFEIRKKTERMWHRSWVHNRHDDDSPIDLINYAGMYLRLHNQGPSWGKWGEPGSGGDIDAVSMGDYSEVRRHG